MPSAGPLYELGIEPSEEWVRQLEGVPALDFANAAAGSDALKLKIRNFSLTRLPAKLDQIIEKYEAQDYKSEYEFLDYFARVRHDDVTLKRELQDIVTSMLMDGGRDVDFADPDVLEPLRIDHYVLQHRSRISEELDELNQPSVVRILADWDLEDPLREVKVHAFTSAGDTVTQVHPLLDYAVADFKHRNERFVLSAGQWFRVAADYVAEVQQRIDAIPDVTNSLHLDRWNEGEDEGVYNDRIARSRGWALLDRSNFPVGGPNQKVEVCDILTPNKEMLCVKRMSKSSTLSHLFSQGTVSAELMAADLKGYRNRLVRSLKKLDRSATFGVRDDWTIVYAIATDKPGPLADSLYFFSKVSLDQAARRLSSFGFKVALARVETSKPKRRPRKRLLRARADV